MDAKQNSTEGLQKLDNGRDDSTKESDLESSTVSNNNIADKTETQEQKTFNSDDTLGQAGCLNDLSSTERPQLLPVLLPSGSKESFSSARKSQEQLKTDTLNMMPPDEDDVCAPILLACLFCHPLDCIVATVRGCSQCLCSLLFCCEPTTVQNLLNITQHCNICRCQELYCCQCDCSICDLCLQATECLDLAMEISQMLYH